jgi:hypothetical protein
MRDGLRWPVEAPRKVAADLMLGDDPGDFGDGEKYDERRTATNREGAKKSSAPTLGRC